MKLDKLANDLCNFISPTKLRRRAIAACEEYIKVKRIIKNHSKVAEILVDNYINPYIKGCSQKWAVLPKQDLGTDKIIWQFWGQGINENIPDVVKACLDSVEKYKGDYKIILLTDDNIKDYIDIPDFIYEKLKGNKEFKYAFFADMLRLYLLSAYGGIWIDATILLTDVIPRRLQEKDFFMFQRGKRPKDANFWENFNRDYFSWDSQFKVRSLNSFIIAKKNNKLINALKDILTNYWQNEEHFIHYFLFQILFNELIQKKEYKNCNCKVESDINPHIMQRYIHSQFNQEKWNYITAQFFVHKLTYFNKYYYESVQHHILGKDVKPYDILPEGSCNQFTFCTMCFNMGGSKISKIKNADRKYQDFYLKSLKKLATRYKNLVLWCDEETNRFIDENNLNNVKTKVMKFEDLPYYKNREKYLIYLREMKEKSFNEGYLLKNLEPEEVVDYLILVLSKIEVIKWAKDNNFFSTQLFCWIDAGMYNEVYNRCWGNWDGRIDAYTEKFKCTFMTEHKQIYKSLIELSSHEDIALIKAPFEIPAAMFMVNIDIVDKFYEKYKVAINFMDEKRMITTEQSIFSVMLKQGNEDLFEFSKTKNYIDIMNLVAKNNNSQEIKNDFLTKLLKKILLGVVKTSKNRSFENEIRQKLIYKPINPKKILNEFKKSLEQNAR